MSFGGFYIFFIIFHFPTQVPKNNVPVSGISFFFSYASPFPLFDPYKKEKV